MALKDWKKTVGQYGKENIKWTHKEYLKGRQSFIQINESNIQNEFYVQIVEHHKNIIDKSVKSKSQAIKIAKVYMRSH